MRRFSAIPWPRSPSLVRARANPTRPVAESIKKAASDVAYDLMLYYEGNQTGKVPGILPGPPPDGDYYWWQGGAMWGTLIDYWHLTGDASYNEVVLQAMIHQRGEPQNAYMPPNWTASMGNDDQGFWGMSAMAAAELKFPEPPENVPSWLELAQGVWNTQASPERHDDVCGGGMRWQVPHWNIGYDYKNTIANGIFFNMGMRLARYTGDDTFRQRAEKTYNWLVNVGYIDDNFNVYDGGHDYANCTNIAKAQFSYNAGVLMQGMATAYNYVSPLSFLPLRCSEPSLLHSWVECPALLVVRKDGEIAHPSPWPVTLARCRLNILTDSNPIDDRRGPPDVGQPARQARQPDHRVLLPPGRHGRGTL